jgi:hypothetical protein
LKDPAARRRPWVSEPSLSLKRCEQKIRPAWGSGPGKGRNLEMFGGYLFFLAAFFFAGMIFPSCTGVG